MVSIFGVFELMLYEWDKLLRCWECLNRVGKLGIGWEWAWDVHGAKWDEVSLCKKYSFEALWEVEGNLREKRGWSEMMKDMMSWEVRKSDYGSSYCYERKSQNLRYENLSVMAFIHSFLLFIITATSFHLSQYRSDSTKVCIRNHKIPQWIWHHEAAVQFFLSGSSANPFSKRLPQAVLFTHHSALIPPKLHDITRYHFRFGCARNRTRTIISISSLFKIGQETQLFEFCIFNKTSSWRLKSESSSELLLLSALALLKPLSWREKNCGLYWKIYWNLSIERGFRVSFPFRSGDISHKSKLQFCEPVFTKSIGALGFPVNNRINQARKDTLPINQPKLTQDLVDHSSHHPSFPYQQPAQQHPVQLFGDDDGKV